MSDQARQDKKNKKKKKIVERIAATQPQGEDLSKSNILVHIGLLFKGNDGRYYNWFWYIKNCRNKRNFPYNVLAFVWNPWHGDVPNIQCYVQAW